MQARHLQKVEGKRGSKRASDIHMPGVNEMYTSEMNKRYKLEALTDGHPKDTAQNTITTTVLCLEPPKARGVEAVMESEWFAPASKNELANTPQRGDWAVHAPDHRNWLAATVSSGQNPNSNALPIFTSMGKVPRKTRIRFAGIVGNASQAKQGDKHIDRFGTIISAGTVTGANTGPSFIPALSKVYASPESYVLRDPKTGEAKPGYMNSGWVENKCDKYLIATFALREGDITAFFIGLEYDLREIAKRDDCMAQKDTILADLRIHPHVPIYKYAKHFLFQAHVEHLMKDTTKLLRDKTYREKVAKVINHVIKENKAYWVEVERETEEINARLGGPQWDNRRDASNELQPLKHDASDMDVLLVYPKLIQTSMEIWKQQFCEHQTWMSDLFMGKARYASAAGGVLDLMLGSDTETRCTRRAQSRTARSFDVIVVRCFRYNIGC